jgi:hypothetical protein
MQDGAILASGPPEKVRKELEELSQIFRTEEEEEKQPED